ncbi:MAG: type II toxin-antitoxin system HicA family toxin [bacterium]|nr:type II toxin-antitoxin system HicA family toxin [bacterium]MCM1500947.1 type II toxin-antitoxin system HicA family toxin [Clostridium sp.]
MKGKELVKNLQKDGWELDRVSGSHHIMRKGDKIVSVPVHNKDLKKGILHNLLKETGLQ